MVRVASEDVEKLERTLVRPSISYRFDKRQAFTFGYDAHFIDAPSRKVEQRLWQQYAISNAFSGFVGSLRARLEQRFIDHVDGVPVRLRLKLGAKRPVGTPPWYFNVSNEVFLAFNEIRGGQRDGFHENRAFAGFQRPLGSRLGGQIGYQIQTIGRSGPNLSIHQLFVGMAAQF